MGPADGHYFEESPQVPSDPGWVRVVNDRDRFELRTDSGTFSPRRLDPGTGFLLDDAPEPPVSGTFLDLGCGYGPLAVALALRAPDAEVWAVDVNERSRSLCEANARAMGCANLRVASPEEVPPEIAFDLVWSNPPIRIGKAALHDLLERWLGRLTDEGSAVLVVSRNLGADSLQRWLVERGFPTERLASRRGYRLLEAQRSTT